jgi:hypothetical protein
MQIKRIRNFPQYHGTHGDRAVLKKLLLTFDNRRGYLEYRTETLMYVLDEPFRLIQMA